MRTKKYWILPLLAFCYALFLCAKVSGTNIPEKPRSNSEKDILSWAKSIKISQLEGLQGVQSGAILLTTRWLEGEKNKFDFQSDLQTQVELALRTAGIKVLPGDKIPPVDIGILLVKVQIWYVGIIEHKPHYGLTVQTTLLEDAILMRNPNICQRVTTWSVGDFPLDLTITPSDEVEQMVKNEVQKQMNEFCNDFLSANPKEQPVKKEHSGLFDDLLEEKKVQKQGVSP